MGADNLLYIAILSPLVGFLINGLRFKNTAIKAAGIIATASVALSFICSVALFFQLSNLAPEARFLDFSLFNWVLVGDLQINMGFTVDPLSILMLLIITGVGTLIHLFSIGYMSHDGSPSRYFAYLNFFVFNMLLLVLGDNLLVMFIGWEGVGLSSYLLIGFWFSDEAKAKAGMKAFITNRIGDAGFLLGIFSLFIVFGTIDFSDMIALVPETPEIGWSGPLTVACLFLFIGAIGKSAQIPLHVWLPDAMAGPTPVSALIHAATMVTAGVYLIVRMSPIFMMAPNALAVIAVVGALTAFFAASIGLTQWDIKKVLAYSTVSQLGFMFLAAGVGAFTAATFHLMTHAFFKALMFLGAGSVIHSMKDEQDMRKMGGLKSYMPITYLTFMAGWLAIIGIPPFSGFFSKDEILWLSLHSPLGGKILWILAAVAAAFTAFYMTRLMALTFWGEGRFDKKTKPHESPLSMTIPLVILALFSIFAGWLAVPHIIGEAFGHIPNFLEAWLSPVVAKIKLPAANQSLEWGLMSLALAFAVISSFLAYYFYISKPGMSEKVAGRLGPLYQLVEEKYRVDSFYHRKIIQPIKETSEGIWLHIDIRFIDRATYLISDLVRGGGQFFRSIQNGNIQQYASFILLGVVMAIFFAIYQVM